MSCVARVSRYSSANGKSALDWMDSGGAPSMKQNKQARNHRLKSESLELVAEGSATLQQSMLKTAMH